LYPISHLNFEPAHLTTWPFDILIRTKGFSGCALDFDDSELVRQGLRTVLQANPEWGVCGEASNGADAVERFKELDANVVIVDFQMPGLNGIETSRRILAIGPAVPIIMSRGMPAANWKGTLWHPAFAQWYRRRAHPRWLELLRRFSVPANRLPVLKNDKEPAACRDWTA
jgi:hypothetical protein